MRRIEAETKKKMDKEERRKQIKEEISNIREQTKILRNKRYALETELDYINGNYDKSWEEKYGK